MKKELKMRIDWFTFCPELRREAAFWKAHCNWETTTTKKKGNRQLCFPPDMKASSLKNERKKKKGVQNTVQAMHVKTSCARTLLCDTRLHPMSFASHPQNRFFRCFDKSTMTTARDTNILNEQQSGMMMDRLKKKSKRTHRTHTHTHTHSKKKKKPTPPTH